jgi:hypothetical protein
MYAGKKLNTMLTEYITNAENPVVYIDTIAGPDNTKTPNVNNQASFSIDCNKCHDTNKISGRLLNKLIMDKMLSTADYSAEFKVRHSEHENDILLPTEDKIAQKSSQTRSARNQRQSSFRRSTSSRSPTRNGRRESSTSRSPVRNGSMRGRSPSREANLDDSQHASRASSSDQPRRMSSVGSWKEAITAYTLQDEMFYRRDFVRRHGRGWDIHKLFKRSILSSWLEQMVREQNVEMVLLLSLLNQWISPYLSDNSEYGLNSYSDESTYFKEVAQGSPYIIDFILDSPDDFRDMQLNKVTDVVTTLYKSRVKMLHEFSLTQGMEYYYRSAFLAWAVKGSTPQQRALAIKLLSHILHFQSDVGYSSSIGRYVCCKEA